MPRATAAATDPRFYYGPLCRNGHDGLRYLIGKACVHCQRQRDKDNRARKRVDRILQIPDGIAAAAA
jgi:hypothetical protein